MIEIAKGNYISRVWFFYDPGGKGTMDVFAHLCRRLPGSGDPGPWTLEYRFRYYVDQRARDSNDRKSGFSGTFDGSFSEAEVVERVQLALQTMKAFLPEHFIMDCTVVETDEPAEIVRLLSQKPYLHIQFEGPLS